MWFRVVALVLFGLVGMFAVGDCVGQSPQLALPDGSLIFSNKRSMLGVWLNRVGPMRYSHVAVVSGGRVWEADWPRVRSVPLGSYGKRRCVYDAYVPAVPFSPHESLGLSAWCSTNLGRPYGFARWVNPESTFRPRAIYCSEFARDALNATGRVSLRGRDGYDPGRLFDAVSGSYVYGTSWSR